MVDISDLQLYRWQIPYRYPLKLKTGPVSTRTGFFVRASVNGASANECVAEAAPLPGFSRDSEATILKAWPDLRAYLLKTDTTAWGTLAELPSMDFALGCIHQQLDSGWQGALSQPVNVLLPTDVEACLDAAKRWLEKGFYTFKAKLRPQNLEGDIAMLRKIAALDDKVRFRLDGNRQLSPGKGRYLAKQLNDLPVDYIEEPLCAPIQLKRWAVEHGLPVALDETLDRLEPSVLHRAQGVKALVVKPSLYGGWARSVIWADLAKAQGLDVVISSGFNSSLGLYHLAHFGAIHGYAQSLSGLSTVDWHESEPMTPVGRLDEGKIIFDDAPHIDWDACELIDA